jgi:hypothetical protein
MKVNFSVFPCFQAEEQITCEVNGESVLRGLCENPNEPKFGNRAGYEFRSFLGG